MDQVWMFFGMIWNIIDAVEYYFYLHRIKIKAKMNCQTRRATKMLNSFWNCDRLNGLNKPFIEPTFWNSLFNSVSSNYYSSNAFEPSFYDTFMTFQVPFEQEERVLFRSYQIVINHAPFKRWITSRNFCHWLSKGFQVNHEPKI